MAGVTQDGGDGASIELVASPVRMLLWILLGLAMTVLSAALAFRLLPGYTQKGLYDYVMSFGGLLLFGASTLAFAWRAATLRGIVISIDSHGILDKRISEKRIPWTAVENVSIRYVSLLTFVFVCLRPEYKASFPVSVHAKLVSVINRPFFGDGYWIALVGLSGSKADLLTAVANYWTRFKEVSELPSFQRTKL